MNKTIIKGNKKSPAIKILPITSAKITEDKGLVYLEGYANTKNKADRYGDVPTVHAKKRSYVYELKDFLKNPVLLIDHVNALDHLAGSVVEIKEDEQGLFFKALFSTSQHPIVAHARHIYKEGHAKGISIAGRFHYEEAAAPNKLTYAEIYEISLVAIPADPDSLAAAVEKSVEEMTVEKDMSGLQQEIDSWLRTLKH